MFLSASIGGLWSPGPWPPHLVLLQWPSGGATTSCHVQHNTSPTINPGTPSHRHQAAAFCTPVRRQNILQDIVFLSISDNHKKYFIFIIYKCLMKLYGPFEVNVRRESSRGISPLVYFFFRFCCLLVAIPAILDLPPLRKSKIFVEYLCISR